jgi:hypothetical protein
VSVQCVAIKAERGSSVAEIRKLESQDSGLSQNPDVESARSFYKLPIAGWPWLVIVHPIGGDE